MLRILDGANSRRKEVFQFPRTALCAMVCAGVSSCGRTDLIVLKSGFRLNQKTYKEKCLIPMLNSLPHSMKAETTIFYQDKAPCHAAGTVQIFKKMSCFVS